MNVVIHTTRNKIYDDEAREVVLPGSDGEFTVMDFHQPCLYSLRAGQIKVLKGLSRGGDNIAKFPIKRGVASVIGNRVSVIIEDL